MAWLDLAEDLEAEFSSLQTWDPGPPEPRKAVRPAPPPDKRLAALEAAATALLRAAEPKPPAPKVPWTERRAEMQRLRREAAREPRSFVLSEEKRRYQREWQRARRKSLKSGTG